MLAGTVYPNTCVSLQFKDVERHTLISPDRSYAALGAKTGPMSSSRAPADWCMQRPTQPRICRWSSELRSIFVVAVPLTMPVLLVQEILSSLGCYMH